MGVFQHIASIGKDRRVLVHDIRAGYFPMHHVNSGVVAFSSLGHVAYHRGHVDRVSHTTMCPSGCNHVLERYIRFSQQSRYTAGSWMVCR